MKKSYLRNGVYPAVKITILFYLLSIIINLGITLINNLFNLEHSRQYKEAFTHFLPAIPGGIVILSLIFISGLYLSDKLDLDEDNY